MQFVNVHWERGTNPNIGYFYEGENLNLFSWSENRKTESGKHTHII